VIIPGSLGQKPDGRLQNLALVRDLLVRNGAASFYCLRSDAAPTNSRDEFQIKFMLRWQEDIAQLTP